MEVLVKKLIESEVFGLPQLYYTIEVGLESKHLLLHIEKSDVMGFTCKNLCRKQNEVLRKLLNL